MSGERNAKRRLWSVVAIATIVALGLGARFAHTTMRKSERLAAIAAEERAPVAGSTHVPVPNTQAPAGAGMRVAVQPETGDLVPAPADAELGDLGLPKPVGDPVVRTLPDGSLHADLAGRFGTFSVAHVGPDGRIVEDCLSDSLAVRQYLQNPPSTPARSAGGEVE